MAWLWEFLGKGLEDPIKDDLKVEYYINNSFYESGELVIGYYETLIELKSKHNNKKAYFLFKNKNDMRICYFKVISITTDEDLIGVGIISRKKLDRKIIEDILNSQKSSLTYLNEFQNRLVKYL